MKQKLNKFGQSLPLNTIVIAILVIVVLLVIIVFFTGQVGETGNQLDENSNSVCSQNNPTLATLGYTSFQVLTSENIENGVTCNDLWQDHKPAIGVENCCVK